MGLVNKGFALLTDDGDVLFPERKRQRATEREGFALSAPGERDRDGQGTYTEDLREVIRRVVFDGWKVRVTTVDTEKRRHGSYGLGKRVAQRYWVAPEFLDVVRGAETSPEKELPSR